MRSVHLHVSHEALLCPDDLAYAKSPPRHVQ